MEKVNIPLERVIIKKMSKPHKAKFRHHENYYLMTGLVPHDILINEQNEIVDGYCSYLIAQKYNCKKFNVYLVNTKRVKKYVICKYIHWNNGKIKLTNKSYGFKYNLRYAVDPGDIVKISNGRKCCYLVVERVEFYEVGNVPYYDSSVNAVTPCVLKKGEVDGEYVMVKAY